MKLKCILLDDEPLALKVLTQFVDRVPQLQLVGSFSNSEEAYAYLESNEVDLLFLDIQMPRLTGTHLFRLLSNPPAVIFVTAFPEYAVEGFDLEAVDFLLKPFTFERFLQAVKRAQERIIASRAPQEIESGSLLVRADKKWYPLEFAKIRYLQAYGDYVKIFLQDEMLLTKDKLSRIYQEELPPTLFFRIHRSYVVALNYIDYVEGNRVFVEGKSLPIGSGVKAALLELLKG